MRVMQKLIVCAVMFSTFLSFGCGSAPRGGPREATYPIVGLVVIDGEPQEQVQVICHAEGDSKVPMNSAAYTDKAGAFSIGTYESGDGAPAGSYKLTFMWGAINLMSGRYSGPDKLNDRYSDPATSEFVAKVVDGEKCDLGVIALTTE